MKKLIILSLGILTLISCERENLTVQSDHLTSGIVYQVQCFNGVKGDPNVVESAPYEIIVKTDEGALKIIPATIEDYETIIPGDTIKC